MLVSHQKSLTPFHCSAFSILVSRPLLRLNYCYCVFFSDYFLCSWPKVDIRYKVRLNLGILCEVWRSERSGKLLKVQDYKLQLRCVNLLTLITLVYDIW